MSARLNALLLNDHSITLSTALHLLPGLVIMAVYAWIGLPISEAVGYPPLLGFLIAVLIVLVPWQLGLLLYLGRERNGKWSLDGVVLFRNHLPKLSLFAIVLGLSFFAILVAAGLSFIDTFLLERLFYWFPERFYTDGFDPANYSAAIFNIATIINLLAFGIMAPWIEELYFRGFLLPRMSSMGRAAPFVNSILFALYHFWSPWLVITRILFVTPMVWVVWKKQAIEVSIWTHCLLNSFGILLTYAFLMSTN